MAEPGSELTQPSPCLLAEPSRLIFCTGSLHARMFREINSSRCVRVSLWLSESHILKRRRLGAPLLRPAMSDEAFLASDVAVS